MTDQNAPYSGPDAQGAPRFIEQASAASTPAVAPQQGIGPYTIREWIVIGAAVLLLLLSFFSRAQSSTFIGYSPVWTLGIAWLPAVVLPALAAGLIAVRRANSVRNFGSLSIDQFASVTFVGAAITWLHIAVSLGSLASWVTWVALVISLAGVFFTVFARFVAPFSDDFTGREEIPAHVAARPVRPVAQAPRPAAPTAATGTAPHGTAFGAQAPRQDNPFAAPAPRYDDPFRASADAAPAPSGSADGAPAHTSVFAAPGTDGADRFAPPAMEYADVTRGEDEAAETESTGADAAEARGTTSGADAATADEAETSIGSSGGDAEPASEDGRDDEPVVAQPAPQNEAAGEAATAQQPFWALVPEERDVHDFEGHPIYKIGPTAWALVLEDRGSYFVMRHDDGRIGYLHNVAGVTRG